MHKGILFKRRGSDEILFKFFSAKRHWAEQSIAQRQRLFGKDAVGAFRQRRVRAAGRSVSLGSSYQCTTSIEASCATTTSSSRQVDVCP